MFVEERHDKIISKLNKDGKVKVKELSDEFNVTEDCIRKDLTALEKKGLLKRTYGGAVFLRTNVHNVHLDSRKSVYLEEKKKIALKAISLIKEDDTIFLGLSTINIELAKIILEKNLSVTVVTNMIEIMQLFATNCNIKLIFIGGTFNKYKDGFLGAFSIDLISRFKFDISFLGVAGIDVYDNSVSTCEVEDGITKQAILKASKSCYILSEINKFNRDGNYTFARLGELTGLITSEISDINILEKLKECDLELIISK